MTENRLSAIVSEAEVIRVHGNAKFGTMTPREVVNDGVRKAAVGYHTGHTQFCILRDHGLITKPRGMSYDVNLTKKGKKYARGLSIFAQDRGAAAPSRDDLISMIMEETTDDVMADGWQSLGKPNILVQGCRFVLRYPQNTTEGYANPKEAAEKFAGFIADRVLASLRRSRGEG